MTPSNSSNHKLLKQALGVHAGGKLETHSRTPLDSDSLRLLYTPGVAEVCRHLKAHPKDRLKYTWVGSTVAVVTNGTAVLNLSNIGPSASLPVMEAKAVIFRKLAQLNAVPILIWARDPDTFIATVEQIAPSFGAIMLEDIESPACFAIERELQRRLAIPVLHADQHATAVVVLATVVRAASFLHKPREGLRILIHGAGPSGLAIARLLHIWGVRQIIVFQNDGKPWPGRRNLTDLVQERVAAFTNPKREQGRLEELLVGKDILISTSRDFRFTKQMIARMAPKAVVLAISNPQPAIAPEEALAAGCAFALDGTTVNNILAFPGLFKGALEAQAGRFTDSMLLAAAQAIAIATPKRQLVPNQLDRRVHHFVAQAVKHMVRAVKVKKRPL